MKERTRKQSFRRSFKVLALALILTLALPSAGLATTASLRDDTTAAGTSLAGTKYKAKAVDIQFSLAEDASQEVVIPTNLTEEELAAAVKDGKISFNLTRNSKRSYVDPKLFPNAYAGGALDAWKTQGNTQQFEATVAAEGTKLKVTIKSNCYFYGRDGKVDYSVPHNNGGAFLDICGYFTLTAVVDSKTIGSLRAKVVPYDSYRTVYELYDDMEALVKAGKEAGLYVKMESMGNTTTDGFDMPYLVIADKKSSVDKWLKYTDAVETNPKKVLKDIKAGKYDDLRVPAFASNCHSNENSAVNGIMNFAEMLVENAAAKKAITYKDITGFTEEGKKQLEKEMDIRNAAIAEQIKDYVTNIGVLKIEETKDANGKVSLNMNSKAIDLAKYYNVVDKSINVKNGLLRDVFFVLIPEQNIEGYQHNTRTTSEGYDPNRDEANQTLNEDANLQALVNKYNPMVFTEIHGRVTAGLIEPCTPPHEPNFEYDLIAKQFIELGESLGVGAIANNDKYNSYSMPYRDYLEKDSASPTGVKWTEPWDDMTTAYGSQFPVLIGTAGITWELPAYDDVTAEDVVPYGLLTQGIYIQNSKTDLLTSQAELFKRGVYNENSNDKVASWYVNQYDKAGADADIMRPVYDGEGQNGNFYPECYIIPLDKANQTNLQDAAEDIKYLTRNDIKVYITKKAFTYNKVKYPAGTAIVTCYQAKRSLLNSQLSDGTFITNWADLYSESFAQRSHARGYDRIIVAENSAYKKIMKACKKTALDYDSAMEYLKNFTSQFSGSKNKDVVIENASEDAAAAVNYLLKKGKKVGVITSGKDKGDFITSYKNYQKVAKKYILSARGVKGSKFKAKLISEAPTVYIPGKADLNTSGYIYTTIRSGSYNYMFDLHAFERMGFKVTSNVADADVIIGASALDDSAKTAVAAGTPYFGYTNNAYKSVSDLLPGAVRTSHSYGTDALVEVTYPTKSLINSNYINEGDNILYEYGGAYFTTIPEGATTLVQNAGKTPLQGCIGIFDDATKAEYNAYISSVQGFEYKTDTVDIVMFANAMTYKVHQRDEYTFLSNFAFAKSLSSKSYKAVA